MSCHPGVPRAVLAGTRCPSPSVRSPLTRMNRQMVQNAARGRAEITVHPSARPSTPYTLTRPAVRLEHRQSPRDTPARSRARPHRCCPPHTRTFCHGGPWSGSRVQPCANGLCGSGQRQGCERRCATRIVTNEVERTHSTRPCPGQRKPTERAVFQKPFSARVLNRVGLAQPPIWFYPSRPVDGRQLFDGPCRAAGARLC